MNKKYLFLVFIIIIVAVFGLIFVIQNRTTTELQVIFLDVGQGDSHLILSPGGQNILIDGGPDKTVLEKLAKYLPPGERTIDLMVLTHPHADHTAGLVEVLQRYNVQRVLATGVVHTTDTYLAWLDEVKSQEIIFDQALAGRQYEFESSSGAVTLEVLYPDREIKNKEFDDLNESSIVIMLNYLDKKFLFTGDISIDNEKRILNNFCYDDYILEADENLELLHSKFECSELKSDVLKVAHQGSDTSSSQEFLDAADPQYAIIPVGENNYGHPSLRIIRRLERLGSKILRTDQNGDIIFTVDNQGKLKSID